MRNEKILIINNFEKSVLKRKISMRINDIYCRYFQVSVENIPSSKLAILLCFIIEHFPVFCLNVVSSNLIEIFYRTKSIDKNDISKSIYYKFSLLPYLDSLNFFQSSTYLACKGTLILFFLVFTISFYPFIYFVQKNRKSQFFHNEQKEQNKKAFNPFIWGVMVHLYEIFFFRILSFWIIFLSINQITLVGTGKIQSLIAAGGFLVLIVYIPTLIYYFRHSYISICLFKNKKQYPFDEFSSYIERINLCNKFLLAISMNYLIVYSNIHVCLMFSSLSIILALFGFVKTFFSLFFSYSDYLFIRNNFINSFRLFILICQAPIVMGHLIFKELHLSTVGAAYFVSSLSLSVIITSLLVKNDTEKIKLGNNIFNQILLMIQKFSVEDESCVNSYLKNWLLLHCLRCKSKEECMTCKYFNKKEVDLVDYIDFINGSLEKEAKNSNDYLKVQIIDCFLKINQKSNKFLLNIFFIKNIAYYLKHHPTFAMNLYHSYHNFLKADYNNILQIGSIIHLEEQVSNTKQIITNIKEILFNENEKPSFFVENACSILNIQKEFNKGKSKVSQYDKSHFYQFMIIKFISELLFKNQANVISSLYFTGEILTEHFEKEKFFLLSYEVKMKKFKIVRSGREYCQFEGISFTDLFPLQNIVEKYLEETIVKDDHNIFFEFPIQNYEKSDFVDSFKMTFKIYPSIDLQRCLIICFYHNKYSNAIITLSDKDKNYESIVTYNYQLKDYLLLTPDILAKLSQYHHNLLFSSIFKIKNKKTNSLAKEYTLTPSKYLSLINKEFDFFKEIACEENYMSIQKHLDNKDLLFQKTISLFLTSKKIYTDIAHPNLSVTVYSFIKNSKKKFGFMEKGEEQLTKSLEMLGTTTFISNVGPLFSGTFNDSSSASMKNSSKGKSQSSVDKGVKTALESKQDSKKHEITKLYLFKNLILVYCIILFLIMIVFLTTEIQKINQFNESFVMYQLWHRFFRLVITSTMNFFFLVCPASPNNECKMNFTQYINDFQIRYNTNSSFDIFDYMRNELDFKLFHYQKLLSELKGKLEEIDNPKINKLFNSQVTAHSFAGVGYNLSVIDKSVTFYENLLINLNYLNNIVKNDNFSSIPIQFIKVYSNGDIDISNLILTDDQHIKLDAYSVIINFRNIFMVFLNLTTLITEMLINNILSSKFIGFFFLSFLFCNHCLVFGICFYVCLIFKQLLAKNFEFLMLMFKMKNLIELLQEKVIMLERLSSLYLDDPIKIINDYEKKISQYKFNNKKEKQYKKEEQKETTTITKKDNNTYYDEDISKMLSSSFVFIYLLIAIYVTYSLYFYVNFSSTIYIYTELIYTYRKNADIDINIYSSATILQIMIYTNQTDYELQTFYGREETDDGYVFTSLRTVLSDLEIALKKEVTHLSVLVPLTETVQLGCLQFFRGSNDTIIEGMKAYYTEDYGETFIYETMENICSYYTYMVYMDDKILMREMIYQLFKINNNMIHSYEQLFQVSMSQDFLDSFLSLLLIYRPIRHYAGTTVFLGFIAQLSVSYTKVIYSYLIVNSLFEILLFLVLKFFILSKFFYINKAMEILENFFIV